jgi:prepilin-type N-terminal cleavage/methylation domain-containing protein
MHRQNGVQRQRFIRQAYSLIELVVVLMILAIVAGLTVSVVDWMRRSADKAAAANVMGSLLSNVQLYRTTFGNYPNQFDSLVETGGGTIYSKLHEELSGERLTVDKLEAGEVESLKRVGIDVVMDQDKAASFPGNSGTVRRLIVADGSFAFLKPNDVMDSIYPAGGGVSGSGLPLGVRLVVFGFGPNNTAIGKTIVSPPAYSGVGDPSQKYSRFLCVFAVFKDGETPAQIKAVLDSKGDFLNEELTEFYQSTPK